MVNVYVSPKRKKFHLHKVLLEDRSGFFRMALDGGFKEQEERAVYLPDGDVAAFELFVLWLYGSKLAVPTAVDGFMTHLKLYAMAEKFSLEELKNMLMDLVRTCCCQRIDIPTYEHVAYIYQSTPENSPMRLLVSRVFAYILNLRGCLQVSPVLLKLVKEGGDFSADFTLAMFHYRANDIGLRSDPRSESKCLYHEHKSTKSCS